MLREAADAGAEFVRCAEFVGAVVGYDYRDGSEGVGYYRHTDAPPPDQVEYAIEPCPYPYPYPYT